MGLMWRSFRPMRAVVSTSLLANAVLLLLYFNSANTRHQASSRLPRTPPTSSVPIEERPYIFVGGVPRSGTTLTRVLLDAHPDIRCGQETRLIPRILGMRDRWRKSDRERQRLEEAGLNERVLNVVIRNFISNVIEQHGPPARRLCNKDPLALNYMEVLARMFPRAKYILLIRDGRAVAHSIVSRNVTISGVDSSNFVAAAVFWNRVMEKMWRQCHARLNICLPVYYEELVAKPQQVMKNVLRFLDVAWHDNVLKHHQLIYTEVSLSKMEPSTNQVKQAINTQALSIWQQRIPPNVQQEIYKKCPMLKTLGYTNSQL